MNKFLLLKARTPDLYARALDRLSNSGVASLALDPDVIELREFPESLVLLASFELPGSAGFNKRYTHHADGHSLVFDGLPYFTALDPQQCWARQLDQEWKDDEHTLEHVFGTWALCRFDGLSGARCLGDFSGMTPLYFWADDDYVAVSPRQMLLANVCGSGEMDMEAMAWLTGQSNLMGDQMPWRGVRHLPPQHTLMFSARRADMALRVTEREVWSRHVNTDPDLERIEGIAAAMLDQCSALAKLPMPPLRVDITGGLDSRLVLALVLGSKLRDRLDTLRTFGAADAPDMQVGRAVAEAMGLPHSAHISGSGGSMRPAHVLESVRASTFRYEAGLTPSDGLVGGSPESTLVLTGSAGEIYRRHCKPHMKLEIGSREELRQAFASYHQPLDPLGVQMPDVSEKQVAQMQRWALELADRGVEFNDITDVFFMRYRLPLWNGLVLNNLYYAVRVYPLVNLAAARYAFSRGYKARVHDRIHFELMLRLNPKLVSMPFLSFAWPKEYREMAAKVGVHVAEAPHVVKTKPSSHLPVHFQALGSPEGWAMVRDYVLDAGECPLWDVIDRKATEAMFEAGPGAFRGVSPYKELFSLIGLRSAATRDWVRNPDGGRAPPQLVGDAAQRLFGTAATA